MHWAKALKKEANHHIVSRTSGAFTILPSLLGGIHIDIFCKLKGLELTSPWMDQPYYFKGEIKKIKPASTKVTYLLQVCLCLLTTGFQQPLLTSVNWSQVSYFLCADSNQVGVCSVHKYSPGRVSTQVSWRHTSIISIVFCSDFDFLQYYGSLCAKSC